MNSVSKNASQHKSGIALILGCLMVLTLQLPAALEPALPELRPTKPELTQVQEPRSYKWYWLLGATICSGLALSLYGILHRPKSDFVSPYEQACEALEAAKKNGSPAAVWEILRNYLLATFTIKNPGVTANELVHQLAHHPGLARSVLAEIEKLLIECETASFAPGTKVDVYLVERAEAILNHVEARSVPVSPPA